jgi:asparagine synthase (glutamine-hydrolysing)
MCGIVGTIDFRSTVVARELQDAANTLYNRGPDDSGVWVSENVGLGHRRLAILDVTPSGHQPMISADGRFVIVFNGEIYNFMELRQQLTAGETCWQSRSDTEVILAAYAKWGTECLRRFHGMFAFAIWDRRERTLFGARDRMGVKPFYYHASPDYFAFASRPRALLALKPDLSRELDPQALRLYLECGYVPAPYSIFRQVRKLPPAHWLLLGPDGLRVEPYWDFRKISPEPSWEQRPEADLIEELDSIVTRSIRSRMISDVPLGAFLSGGIDSSVVVAVMAKHSPQPVKTFTIGFEEKKYDESGHADAVARHLKTEHYCQRLTVNDLLELLPDVRREFDEPFSDYSAFPTMAVSRLARGYVTVSLSGDGGDELFGGYHYYQIARRIAPVWRLPTQLRNALGSVVAFAPSHRAKLLSAALQQNDDISAFAFMRSVSKDFDEVLSAGVVCETKSMGQLFLEAASAFAPGLTESEKAMRLDVSFTLPDDYLQKVDVSSMTFSLESRDPLLDHDLVEWCMRLPLKWKLRGGENKYLLRRLAYQYVPREILDRPKQGFGVPMAEWLRGPLKDWAHERLSDREIFETLPLNQSKILDIFRLHCTGQRNAHGLLWAVLMLSDFVGGLPCLGNRELFAGAGHGR